jgi:hypothetical protein
MIILPISALIINVLHSAGCGRTGTFCTIDTVLGLLLAAKSLEFELTENLIPDIITRFRTQRMETVQTAVRYHGEFVSIFLRSKHVGYYSFNSNSAMRQLIIFLIILLLFYYEVINAIFNHQAATMKQSIISLAIPSVPIMK